MNAFRLSLIGLLVAAPLCVVEPAEPLLPGEGVGVDITQPAGKVLREGGWELQIWYRAKGSRSEGQHGVLLHDGKTIKGVTVGEELDTALGKMKYYGTAPSVPWNPSGWHFADKGLIKPSTFCP
jgi:hypothetical protein